MAELFVFTIIAAVATIYSILPDRKQKRIHFAFPPLFKYFIWACALSILLLYLSDIYLELVSPSFSFFCSSICLPAQFWVKSLQIVIISVASILIIWKLTTSSPTIHNDSGMAEILRKSYFQKEYSDFTSLVADNYEELIGSSSSSSIPMSRATTEKILTDEELLEIHPHLDPTLANKIIQDRSAPFNRLDFIDQYLKALLDDESSVLYHEIANNRNGEYGPYEIPLSNRLLYSLFSDCEIAKELKLWQPITTEIVRYLDYLSRRNDDPYINRNPKFRLGRPEVVFRDRIFVGIRLYNIMAAAALEQHVQTHLSMQSFWRIVKEICENYELGTQADASAEFPNDYSYILYEIFSVLEHLIELSVDKNNDVRRSIGNSGAQFEEDIIKMSIYALVKSHEEILKNSKIPDQFKTYLTNGFIETYLTLSVSRDRKSRMYALAFREYILNGAPGNINSRNRQQYHNELFTHLRRYDTAKFATAPAKGNIYEKLLQDI